MDRVIGNIDAIPIRSLNYVVNDQGFSVGDRAIGDILIRDMNRFKFSDGILFNPADTLKVFANSGMIIKVNAGYGIVGGVEFVQYETDMRYITIDPSDPTVDRTDRIVMRWDNNTEVRNVQLVYKKSDLSVIRTVDVVEIALADIFVGRGATTITQASITDLRLDESVCGVITNELGRPLDLTSIFNQYQTALNEHLSTARRTQDEANNLLRTIITDINLVVLSVSDFDANDRFPGTKVTVNLTGNPYLEQRKIISDNFLLAERSTFFHADNIYVTETTTFYPRTWTVDARTVSSFANVRKVITNLQTLESEVQ